MMPNSNDPNTVLIGRRCPHCNQLLRVASAAIHNVDSYGQPVTAKAYCCGRGVGIAPIKQYRVYKYDGKNTEDDWGQPLKK